MKTLFPILLLICLWQDLTAQVSGKLTKTDGHPVPYVNVALLRSTDTSLIKATLSDDKGVYQIENIGPGRYLLRFSSIGFLTWHSSEFELSNAQRSFDLGTQVMKENSQELKEVVVRAEKPLFQQQAYGTVVNVESSVLTKGSSVLEVLERSPGVFIDRRYNTIALHGKNGVMVSLNGKLMRLSADQVVNLLNGMSANDIEKIELMTTPPARYDAEGNAGIINIVLKKSRNQGNISLSGGYGWGEKATASINMARTVGKTNLYGSYSYAHDKTYMNWFAVGTDSVPVLGGKTYSEFLSEITPIRNSHNATLGFDTRLAPKLLVGGNVTYNFNHLSEEITNHAEYQVEPDSFYILDARIHGPNSWKNLISSAFIEKKLGDGEQLNIDFDYLHYKNDKPTNAYSLFVNKEGIPAGQNDTLFSPYQRAHSNSTIQVGVVKVDYSKQLSPALRLETGVKGTYTRNESLSGIESLLNGEWVSRPTTTNNVVMKEGIGAGYASLNAKLSASINLSAGARYEYSNTQMNDPIKKQEVTDRKLGKIFPTVFLTWKVDGDNELQVSYTKRISRPTYNDLASFVVYTDPTSVETGNSLLQPTITNNLKIGYNYKGYAISLLLSRDDHPIARFQIVSNAEGDLLVTSPQNLIYQNNITLTTSLPFKPNNWWSMSYGLAGGWRQFKLDYTAKPVKKSYFAYSANFSQAFTLPYDFSVELSGWYNSLAYNGSKKVDGFGAINGGIRKDLKNNWGSLQFAVQDIFRTTRITSYFGAITEEAFDLRTRVPFSTETTKSPIFRITYTRSFGNNTIKGQRGQGAQDERNRIMN